MPKVSYTPHAMLDIASLPTAELQADCLTQLQKLEHNIHLGQSLFNKHGNNLTGCYKIFFGDAKYRIIYRIIEEDTAEVFVVGPRAKEQVYKTAHQRLHPNK